MTEAPRLIETKPTDLEDNVQVLNSNGLPAAEKKSTNCKRWCANQWRMYGAIEAAQRAGRQRAPVPLLLAATSI
jgi:hypothetical protein